MADVWWMIEFETGKFNPDKLWENLKKAGTSMIFPGRGFGNQNDFF